MELLVIIIVLALIFDYINGFHDAANSIATIVSTKVLTPFQAVIWAAFFNFVAFFIAKYLIGGFGIANTVSKTVMEQFITLPIILSGVIAAIAWNLFTWWRGIPSSSSHTLIGGFAGAAIMAHGFDAIQLNIILKIAAFIFLAPLIGMIVAFGFTLLVLYACRRAHPHTAEVWFKKLQLVSSAMFSIGHGLNDYTKPVKVNVRVIAATNRDLAKEIADGHFREDLFYRLSVFHIHLPPLRERVDDIPLHVEAFVSALSSKIGKTIRTISPDYVRILKRYPWKGNVRELRNVVERSLIISDGDTLTADTLPLTIQNPQDNTDSSYSGFDLDGVEKMHIQKVLKYTNGNKTETSRLLGIGLTTLYRKIEEYGL